MIGRAVTPEQKRAILERIFEAWGKSPQQRLGQLISNSIHGHQEDDTASLYFVEDEILATWAEEFVSR